MSIQYQKESRTITIDTLHTTYQLRVDPHGFLQHLYYGKKIQGQDMSYLYQDYDRACAGNPDEAYPSRRISFNTMPQEYTGYGVGDFRISSLAVQNADGSYGGRMTVRSAIIRSNNIVALKTFQGHKTERGTSLRRL